MAAGTPFNVRGVPSNVSSVGDRIPEIALFRSFRFA